MMKRYCLILLLGLAGSFALIGGNSSGQTGEADPKEVADTGEVEVLAQGPVHEAFANPLDYNPQLGPTVNKEPPAAIEEVAPDLKPEGNDIEWIPGYWWWDEEEKGYFWVSGFWRDMPPGRRWVPGNWQTVADGWQWSPGFWASEEEKEIPYVPYPPPCIDAGPSTPAPDQASIYVSGIWVWRETRYAWRPGYWMAHRPAWVYCPAHYVRTSGGCVFVDGFWDYPMHHRGLLFAPLRFARGATVRSYTPSYVVRNDFLLTALYASPHRDHYYFGNYGVEAYQRRGFVAWTDYRPNKRSIDPDYSYYRATYRADPSWDRSIVSYYKARGSREAVAAPRTYKQQQQVVQQLTSTKRDNVVVVKDVNITNIQSVTALTTLKEVTNTKVTGLATLAPQAKVPEVERAVKLKEVSKEERALRQKNAQSYQELSKQRQQIETRLLQQGGVQSGPATKEQQQKPIRLDLPTTTERERPRTKVQPPPQPTAPKVEEKVAPRYDPPKLPKPRPTQPDNKPVKPDDKPVKPDNKPVKPDNKPVKPDNKPVKPDNKPVKPDDKPVKPDNKPVKPDDKPVPEKPKPVPENKPVQPEKPKPNNKPDTKPVQPEKPKPDNKPVQPEKPKPAKPDKPK